MANGVALPFYEIRWNEMGTGDEKTLPTQRFNKGSTGEHWHRKTIFHHDGTDLTNTPGEMDAKHRAAPAMQSGEHGVQAGDTA